MRRLTIGGAVLILVLADACSPAAPGNQAAASRVKTMDHLRCAAMISAADKLVNSGAVPADPQFGRTALSAAMTHLNAHAVPKHMAEKDAFAAAEAERTRIVAEMPPAQIVEQAKACVAQVSR